MSEKKSELTLSWLRQQLKGRFHKPVLSAYILNEKDDFDHLVLAAVIDPVSQKDSLQVSEAFHERFTSEAQWPQWDGKAVDVQFYYPGDVTWNSKPIPEE